MKKKNGLPIGPGYFGIYTMAAIFGSYHVFRAMFGYDLGLAVMVVSAGVIVTYFRWKYLTRAGIRFSWWW